MIGRNGSFIGNFEFVSALMPGVWRTSEAFILTSKWPSPTITQQVTSDGYTSGILDVTETGGGTLSLSFDYQNFSSLWNTAAPSSATIKWYKKAAGSQTLQIVSGEQGTGLVLSGLSQANDGDKYVAVSSFGQPTQTATSDMWTIRFDTLTSSFPFDIFDVYISSPQDAIFYGPTPQTVGDNYGGYYYNQTFQYQWQHSLNGTSWSNVTGGTSQDLIVPVSLKTNGRLFRLRATRVGSTEVFNTNAAVLYLV